MHLDWRHDMANNAIIGEWEYCPDGVDFYVLDPENNPIEKWGLGLLRAEKFGELDRKWKISGNRPNAIFTYRTERREKMRREMDPKSPIVVEFANAVGDNLLITFLGKYGLPDVENDETPLNTVDTIQARMRAMLKAYSAGGVAETVEAFDKLLPDLSIHPDLKIRPGSNEIEMTLRCNNLAGFMTMELAAIVAGNAQVLRCIHCNNIFTAGVGGARKKTAHYCSNKCRVAAQRAAAKAEQERVGK